MKIEASRKYRRIGGLFAGLWVFSLVFFTGTPAVVVLLLIPVIVLGSGLLAIAIEQIMEDL